MASVKMALKCPKPGEHSQEYKKNHSSEDPDPQRGQRQALLSLQREGRSRSSNSKEFPPLLRHYEPQQDRRETYGRFGQYCCKETAFRFQATAYTRQLGT